MPLALPFSKMDSQQVVKMGSHAIMMELQQAKTSKAQDQHVMLIFAAAMHSSQVMKTTKKELKSRYVED